MGHARIVGELRFAICRKRHNVVLLEISGKRGTSVITHALEQ